jgi:hypothetical protein
MPSPGHFRPCQRSLRFIVMLLGGDIKGSGRNCPHGAKMVAVTYPSECLKYISSPLLKAKLPCHPPAVSARAKAVAG